MNFLVKVAMDKKTKSEGLMWVEKLHNYEGMLFLYEEPQIINIWMHNTYIPLDIIFINQDKKIVSIKNGLPLSKQVISSGKKVIAVLECKELLRKNQFNIGDRISWEFIEPSKKRLLLFIF